MTAVVPALERRGITPSRFVGPALVVAVALAAHLAARGELGRPAIALAGVVGGLVAALAVRHPSPSAAAGVALVAVVPVYWAQPLPVLPLAGTAAAVTGVLLLPAAVSAVQRTQVTVLDGLVALYFAAVAASILLNIEGQAAALADLAARSIVPFLVFRLLATRPDVPRLMAGGLVAVAVPLAFLGVREGAGHGNPFFTLVRPGFEAGQWLRSQVRFGQIRAEASFGHAIAFSLFLAVVLVLLLGLAWGWRWRGRMVAVGMAALLVAALLATVSRGGVLSLLVGGALWAATVRTGRSGLLVVAAVVAGGLLLTPAGDAFGRLQESIDDSSEAGEAVRYRLEIASLVADPDSFSLLGHPAAPGLGVVAGAKERLGLRTIDSQYALVYVTHGVLALLAFAGIALAVIALTVRRRLDPVERAWLAATGATAVALGSVALFTQVLTLFWIAVGVSAAVAARR